MTEPTFDPRRKAAIRELIVTTAAATGASRGRKRTAFVVTLVLLAVGISGGGIAYALGSGLLDPLPVPSPTPTVTSSPAPSQTPTPAPTATPTTPAAPPAPAADPADPATWTIGFDGVGPAKLGTPFRDQHSVLPAFTDATESICVDVQSALTSPGGLRFLFLAAADGSSRTAAIEFGNYGVGEDDSAITPRTSAGIGISSTEDELLAAYPDIQKTYIYGDVTTDYAITDGQGGWIVFATMNGAVFDIQVGNDTMLPVGQGSARAIPSERCPA